MKKIYFLSSLLFCLFGIANAQDVTIDSQCFGNTSLFNISGQDGSGRNTFVEIADGMGNIDGAELRYDIPSGAWVISEQGNSTNILFTTGPNTFSPNPPDSNTATWTATGFCTGTTPLTITGPATQTTSGSDPCDALGGDSDMDGVCDDNDVCPGSDDGADMDSDGIPDGCDANPTTADGFLIESPCFGQTSILLTLDGTDATGRNIYRNTGQSLEVLYNSTTMNWEVREINAGMAVLFTSAEASSPNPPSSSFSPYTGSGFCTAEMGMVTGSGTQDMRCLNSCDDGDPCTTDTQDIDCNCTNTPDAEPPVISNCPTTLSDGVVGFNCLNATPDYAVFVTVTDNCDAEADIVITQFPPTGTMLGVGMYEIKLVATDTEGNTSDTCRFVLNNIDSSPPEAECQDIEVYLDGTGMVTIDSNAVDNGSSDNCEIAEFSVSLSSFDCNDALGSPLSVTMTVTDNSALTNSCDALVTVSDTIRPVVTCTEFSETFSGCGDNHSFNTPGLVLTIGADGMISSTVGGTFTSTLDLSCVSDNCTDLADIRVEVVASSEENRVPGCSTEILNQYVAIDAAGNRSLDTITFRGIIEYDGPAPEITCPADSLVDCDVIPVADPATAIATSGCGTPEVTVSAPVITGEPGKAGTTYAFTFTATDGCGQTTDCVQTFTLQDTVPPVLVCVSDTIVQLDETGNATLDPVGLIISATDNCMVTDTNAFVQEYDCSDVATGQFNFQNIVVIFDRAGQGVQGVGCAVNITVVDTIAPVIVSCVTDTTVYLDENGFASIAPGELLETFDACPPQVVIGDPLVIFGCGDAGETYVYEETDADASGNLSEVCTVNVTVLDTIAPVIVSCVTDTTVYLDENGFASIAPGELLETFDFCPPQVVIGDPLVVFGCGDAGETYVYEETDADASGNLSEVCTVNVTVLDTIAPVIVSCVTDTTVYLDENGFVSIAPGELLETFDACPPQVVIGDPLVVFGCGDAGETYVYEETDADASGNLSEVCTVNVTVLDTIAPVIVCADTTIYLDESGVAGLVLPNDLVTMTDACITPDPLDIGAPAAFGCSLVGTPQFIPFSATDPAGNTSECSSTITVLDTISPVLLCETDVTIAIDEMGSASVTDTTALLLTLSDNCTDSAAIVVTLDAPVLSCDGTTGTATVTVADAYGNTASCMVGLTAVDEIAPTAVCQDVTVELDATGLGSLDGVGAGTGTAAVIVTGSLDDTDAQFARPNANGTTCTTSVGDDHYYDVLNFTIDSEDMYTLSMTPNANGDFFFVLYEGGFDAAAPCDNFLEGDDDASGSLDPELMIQLTLVPGQYTLVTTTFAGGLAVGAYEISISGENGGMAIVEGADDDDDDDDATSSVLDGGSTDNCGDITFSESLTDFTCADIGENTVTLTVTDASGNTSTCTATVTVEDNIDPVVTTTDQVIVLNDGNISQTLLPSDLATATDNCGDPITIEFDRPLTFDGDDIGTQVLTVTVTDANGNVVTTTVTVVVTFDQPNLACIGEINLTLNDECQALVIPRMVLVGNVGLIDAFPFEIVVNDSDPSNGPIVDGCGEFTYSVSVPTANESVTGFVGSFAGSNWTVTDNANADEQQLASATFTTETLVMSTTGSPFGVGGGTDFELSTSIMFSSSATVSFDYDLNGVDAGFDDVIIVYNFEGEVVEEVVNTDEPATGSSSFDVEAGYTLEFRIEDDGLQPFGDILATVLTISNFSVDGLGSELALDFETCWGVVRAEDKTPPAVVTTPANIDLLCVDLDGNNLATLPTSVSRCYTVDASTGATVPGTMASALRARLLARTTAPVVPTFTDGCSEEIEVCVSDAVAYGDDPDCDDVVITRTFVATEIAVCASASGEENPSVTASYTITFDRPTLDDLDGDNIEDVVEIESCGADASVRPAPRASDYPFLVVGDRTFNLSTGTAVCNIGVTYSDGPSIVTCPNTYKFVRTYTVIDWCDAGDIRTFTQVVKVGDTTAPTFVGPNVETDADGTLVYGTNAGNICAAYLRLDDVSVTDNCDGAVTVSAEIFPNGDLTAAPIGAFTVIPGGSPELSSAIPAGTHILRYTYSDVCGNTGVTDYDFRVEDQTPPVAICEDGLNISLAGSGANNGFAVLTPENIDNGSYDDCSGVTLEIARVGNNDLPIGLYGPQITLTCADIGTVRVGLKVTDALGNMNFCWLDVLVEDKLAPTCVAPGNTTITCVEYNASLPNDITDATFAQLDALFGEAAGVDNCGTTITQSVSGTINSCGVGRITRRFTSTDGAGFTNTNVCSQIIDVIGIHDYRITFPTDESGDCMEVPSYDGVVAEELACDLITTTVDVDTLRTQDAGEECFKLRVTYDVVNWCEYNSLGEPYVIRRDAPGAFDRTRNPRDIEEDLLYVNVTPGVSTATINDDVAFYSLISTDRIFNPAPSAQGDVALGDNGSGDINDDDTYGTNVYDSRGFFRYTQFIKIYDEVAPEITFTEPAECFAGSGEECRTTVTLEFTATDECSDAVVGVELNANFTGAFVADNAAALGVSVSVANDGDGNYTVTATNVPVGDHAIRVRASDGCGNIDVQIIEFCVTADKSPTPICIQTLTVTLMNDGNGGGIAAIWASDFIASPIEDCFGNLVDKYSLYRSSEAGTAGFTPVAGVLGIDDIDCDDFDNGTVNVRVYAFDDNGSTPDYCEVIVEVQDNMGWCDGSTGNLSGLIATQDNEVIAGVEVNLTSSAGMDDTFTTGADGTYTFSGLPLDADYTVQPVFDAAFNAQNVRASDLVAGIGQILGTAPFTSAYQFVAGDVTQDGSFDVFDILAGQRAILGLDNGFAGGNWFMLEAGTSINMSNPYAVAFPEVYNANDLQGSVTADFVAVEKMNLTGATGRTAQLLNIDDVQLESGQIRTIILDGAQMAGFQGTIELAAGLELISAEIIGEGGLNLNRAGEGMVGVLVRTPTPTPPHGGGASGNAERSGGLVVLEVRATTSGLVSELISLSDAVVVREGVALNGTSNGLDLAFNADFAGATAQSVLFQNTPNPVVNVTSVSFELAAAGAATLTVQDVAGRLVKTIEVDGVAGMNRVELENIGAAGVYSYTLTSGDFTATKQMIVQ
ncbi:T9SS type A sorting domain-containing protein [Neolewinella aurantiaca]|uniref:T9SS type A sorting domain-containing protein n=1 Tax=Neolewinella aurantiaca TaxID=2602767 RepID=A0A5C7FGX8_9BACT|nr:T9SS type A sorting domain-containing protein [Neolewinella aurantiaca]TXF90467.1 T9SS type A sorting domain-containing protein [Neolewinella aurantiaca]